MQPTPPGWYWDPGNRPGLFRWWDGHAWSEHLSADRRAAPPMPPRLPTPGPDGSFAAGGLVFPRLPEPWRACPPYPDRLDGAAGQELVVGQTPRGPYLAVVFVGALAEHAAASELEQATVDLADAALRTYYPHGRPRAGLEVEPGELEGRPAYRLVVRLDIEDEHLGFDTETAVFVLVEAGAATPGVLFASLPDVADVPSATEVLGNLGVQQP